MVKKRRSYSREFKLEAVKLVLEGDMSLARAARMWQIQNANTES